MADDIIKSFLVRIGYKNDEYALKKVTEGISSLTKTVLSLGAGLTAVSTTVAYTVARIAGNLERLYFASMRTGNSASSLKAFDLAAQRMGASAGTGLSAVEGLAAFFRNLTPGTGAGQVFNLFGVHADEKDPVKTLIGIGEAMQKMDYYQARLRGKAIGLTDDQVWFLRQPKLGSMFDQMQKNLGPNFDKAAQDANRFENSLQLLEVRLEGFGVRVIDVLQNKFGWSLDKLSAWFDKNGERLTTSFVNGLQTFLGYLDKLTPKLEWLLDQLVKLDKATNGWSTVLLGLAVVFPGLISSVTSLGVALAGLAIGGAAKGIGALLSLRALGAVGVAGGLGYALGTWWDSQFHDSEKWADIATNIHDWFANQRKEGIFQQRAIGPKQEWAMEQLQKMGWSPAQAAGMVANATAESSMDPNAENAGHRGLFQWSGTRWAGFERFAKNLGLDPNDPLAQLKFVDYDQRYGLEKSAGRALMMAQNASMAGSVFSHYYERHGIDAEDVRRGAAAVNLAHNTTVNINGAEEPRAVARLVADSQERIARMSAAVTREFVSGVSQ
jgi:hypothetical protein